VEWLETTAKSVAEAKDLLMDRLGVDESEAEFEILDEPKTGLFGRPRGDARVRGRVSPKAPPAKEERRRRRSPAKGRKSSGDSGGAQDSGSRDSGSKSESTKSESTKSESDQDSGGSSKGNRSNGGGRSRGSGSTGSGSGRSGQRQGNDRPRDDQPPADPDRVAEKAGAFLTGLAASFDLEVSVSSEITEDGIEVSVDGDGLGVLIGPEGALIDAIGELTRTNAQKESSGASVPRLRVDIGGYRAGRRDVMETFVTEVVEQVKSSGEGRALEPMGSSDRKFVHDLVGNLDGVGTKSEGDDPDRRVVIVPA
jgi:spoIIIJ-associated protein